MLKSTFLKMARLLVSGKLNLEILNAHLMGRRFSQETGQLRTLIKSDFIMFQEVTKTLPTLSVLVVRVSGVIFTWTR